jgi:hypothetical protein
MTEKDDLMVGVGKIETKPIHERKLYYIYWYLNPRLLLKNVII